jgi:hypothetical protein
LKGLLPLYIVVWRHHRFGKKGGPRPQELQLNGGYEVGEDSTLFIGSLYHASQTQNLFVVLHFNGITPSGSHRIISDLS